MNLTTTIFYAFILITGISSFAILITRSVFNAALYLLTCLLAVAALYVFAFAEFVAVTQVMIYAGGVLVIIIFGIMLTSRIAGKPLVVAHNNLPGGIIAAAAMVSLLMYNIPGTFPSETTSRLAPGENIQAIGINLMTTYALPFELSAIILLAALVGAAATTSFMKKIR